METQKNICIEKMELKVRYHSKKCTAYKIIDAGGMYSFPLYIVYTYSRSLVFVWARLFLCVLFGDMLYMCIL